MYVIQYSRPPIGLVYGDALRDVILCRALIRDTSTSYSADAGYVVLGRRRGEVWPLTVIYDGRFRLVHPNDYQLEEVDRIPTPYDEAEAFWLLRQLQEDWRLS